ncbi:DNA glycosylase [Atractiella rhizophila]|nr:DNA glycosylase [Atractiella rhizophila]
MAPTVSQSNSGKLFADMLAGFAFSDTADSAEASKPPRRSPRLHPTAASLTVATTSDKQREESDSASTEVTPGDGDSLKRKRSLNTVDGEASVETVKKKVRVGKKPNMDPKAYQGLEPITDRLGENLHVIFCGCNPGIESSKQGYHYAHPGNRFYKVLSQSGFTNGDTVKPPDSPNFPSKYSIGILDLVQRPTRQFAEVSDAECQGGVPEVFRKIVQCRPRIVIFTALKIYEHIIATLPPSLKLPKPNKLKPSQFVVPLKVLLPEGGETWLVASPGVSGLSAAYQVPELIAIWNEAHRIAEVLRTHLPGTEERLEERKVASKYGLQEMKVLVALDVVGGSREKKGKEDEK